MDTFADVVLAIEDRGVARKELARLADVDPRTVGYWIEGEREPSLAVLRRLLVRGSDEVKAGVFAYLSRGTGWVAAPEGEAGAADAMAAGATVVSEAAELLQAIVTRKPREMIEQEAADVVRAAGLVAGTVKPMRIVGGA